MAVGCRNGRSHQSSAPAVSGLFHSERASGNARLILGRSSREAFQYQSSDAAQRQGIDVSGRLPTASVIALRHCFAPRIPNGRTAHYGYDWVTQTNKPGLTANGADFCGRDVPRRS